MLQRTISKSTAEPLLQNLHRSPKGCVTVKSPTDFNLHSQIFEVSKEKVWVEERLVNTAIPGSQNNYEATPVQYEIPIDMLNLCKEKNVAYQSRLFEKKDTPFSSQYPSFSSPILIDRQPTELITQFEPLSYVSKTDKVQIMLTEPEKQGDKNIIGPILQIKSQKMHITQGYKTSFEWSKKIAMSTQTPRKKGEKHHTLDMFCGLGYASKAVLDANITDEVLTFEKYEEVWDLLRRNKLFSVQHDHKKLTRIILDIDKETNIFHKIARV